MLRPSSFVSELVAIIRPRPELLARSRELDPGLDELFSEPIALKARFGGHTHLSFEEYTRRWEVTIKACHLADLVAEYRSPSNPWLDDLLGAEKVDAGVFDRWWTLDVYGGVEKLVAPPDISVVEVAPSDREWFASYFAYATRT
ncbi:MAG: hypothetical protein U0234_04080 [Sandaracinus sp.]